jgi:cytochrome b6-f complex iron-sulfur subunit
MSAHNLISTGTGTPPADNAAAPERRTFLRTMAGLLSAVYAAFLGYPVYRYLSSPVEKSAEEASLTMVTLQDGLQLPKGTAKMFKFGSRPSLLIHHQDDTWTSFSAVCTHLGCTVQYEAGNQRIHCACHGGVYDPRSGKPTAGPPPKGLAVYRVEIKDGQVNIHRS